MYMFKNIFLITILIIVIAEGRPKVEVNDGIMTVNGLRTVLWINKL